MIFESKYWKNDLLKLANKLELRLIQSRWSQRSYAVLEKEIFVGFYSIRKLIESGKVSKSLINKDFKVFEFPSTNSPEKIVSSPQSEFDFSKAKETSVSVIFLCNQFIHSYYFIPVIPNGTNLTHFFICSDYKKKTGIVLISIFDIVEIYRLVGNNYPSKGLIKKLPSGKVRKEYE